MSYVIYVLHWLAMPNVVLQATTPYIVLQRLTLSYRLWQRSCMTVYRTVSRRWKELIRAHVEDVQLQRRPLPIFS